jgi:hypothetical protein
VGAFAAPCWLRLVGGAHVCASAASWDLCLVVCAHVCAGLSVLGAKLDVADMLPIALGHFDDLGRDSHELAAPLLRAVPAALANRERYLIARASSLPRAFERLAAKKQDGRILVERFAGFAPDLRHCLAKGREHLA